MTAHAPLSAAAHAGSAEVPQPSSTTTLPSHVQESDGLRARLGDCAASTAGWWQSRSASTTAPSQQTPVVEWPSKSCCDSASSSSSGSSRQR
eukprot:6480092-Prymnesium_polylepis.1